MEYHKMTTEFSKDYLPEWCEHCNKQGIYFVDDPESVYLVIHKKCGHEALSAWCENCETGFALPNKPGSQPLEWICPTCKTKYPIPNSIFQKPINLYLEQDLPDDVRARVLPNRDAFNKIENVFRFISTIVSFAGLIISVALHFMFIVNGVRYKEIEPIVFIVVGTMFLLNYHSLSFYFRRLSWHGKIIPIVILCYGFWHLYMGFGTLNKMPPDIRAIASYHQTIFMQSLMVAGYAFFCYYWFYRNQEHAKNNAA